MVEGLMHHTAYVGRYQSTDARGDETHAAAEAFLCRYEPSTRLLRTSSGAQVVSEAVLFTNTEVGDNDLVWPPGSDPASIGDSRKPLRVERHHDLDSGQLSYLAVHL